MARAKVIFFDALDFVSLFVNYGIENALHEHGGFTNIHSVKRPWGRFQKNSVFEIECDLCEDLSETPSAFHYSLCIHNLDRDPYIEESLYENRVKVVTRKGDKAESYTRKEKLTYTGVIPHLYSALWLYPNHPIILLLRNLAVYRIEPTGTKEPDKSDDSTRLERKGHNLASVLQYLESDPEMRENILDWMEMIVPGIENIQTEHQRLDGSTTLMFKEEGTERRFSNPSCFRRDNVRTLFTGSRDRHFFT